MDLDKRLKMGVIHYIGESKDSVVIAQKIGRNNRGVLPFRSIYNLHGLDVPLLIFWDGLNIISDRQLEELIHFFIIRNGIILDKSFNDITKNFISNYREHPEIKIAESVCKKDCDIGNFINLYKKFSIPLRPLTKRYGPKKEEFYIYLILSPEEEANFIGHVGMFSEIIFDNKGKFIKQGFYDGCDELSLSKY